MQTKMAGSNRNVSFKINKLLRLFPAIVILGARQSGKTTLSKQLRPEWAYFDLEKASDFNRIEPDPEFFLQQHNSEIIIDEAQRLPALFDILRGVIDENRNQTGRFIITGSSSPDLLKSVAETLAGRVAVIELGTLKANEIYQQPLSAFYQLLQQPLTKESLDTLTEPSLNLTQMQYAWFKGGYPEPVLKKSTSFYLQWMENYQTTYINRDIGYLFPKLNRLAYQRFLTMLCKLSSTIVNKSELARALEVSEGAARQYLTIAEGTFLWRQLLSYEKSVITSVTKMPKGHIRDTGLLHSLLRITDIEQLYNDPIVGHSFESFVIEEIIKGLQATMLTHWRYYYYRTRNGAEVDLILEGPFGVLPIEVKYGSTPNMKQLRNLETFVVDNDLPFGIVINQSKQACWLSRKLFQLPVNYL